MYIFKKAPVGTAFSNRIFFKKERIISAIVILVIKNYYVPKNYIGKMRYVLYFPVGRLTFVQMMPGIHVFQKK